MDMVPWASVVKLPPRQEGDDITSVRVNGEDVKVFIDGAPLKDDEGEDNGGENGADEDGGGGEDGGGSGGDDG